MITALHKNVERATNANRRLSQEVIERAELCGEILYERTKRVRWICIAFFEAVVIACLIVRLVAG